MIDYEDICKQVIQTARLAGEFIARQRKTFNYDDCVEFKGAHNLVSYVDKGAEEIIVASLASILPGAAFLTEEGTVAPALAGASGGGQGMDAGAGATGGRLVWVVDPLDGTTNFVHGLPPYCVSIALMDGDEIVLGVVYEVTMREMFYAWKGSEAYLDGEVIKVSCTTELSRSLIAIGFSYSALATNDDYLQTIKWYQRNTDGVRRIGSATADLVYVACGRFDAFAQAGLSSWDVAAGALIARQAGAVVSDYTGGGNYVFGGEIVASGPGIYDEFMKTV